MSCSKRSIAFAPAVLLTFLACVACGAAQAIMNASVTGHVVMITQLSAASGYAAETVEFRLDTQPTVTGCTPWTNTFSISPTTIPDAPTRRNMLAILLSARAQGTQVEIAYDSGGGFCDGGAIGVYFVESF